jgi:uncharacterized protein YndB with AHSA1/START domain
MSVHHDTLTVSRDLAAPVATVFGLWADAKALERWYVPGDEGWKCQILEHDFEVGGRKHLSFGPTGEPAFEEDCRFEDIVTDERILFSMTVSSPKARLTTSMVSVEFSSIDSGTRVLMTEQIAILDGGDTSAEREKGWGEVFDRLEKEV